MNLVEFADHKALAENLVASRAKNTRRAYRVAWKSFASKYGDKLPADPLDVALYLSAFGLTACPSTLGVHASAIAWIHKEAGLTSPVNHIGVQKALQGHARRVQHVPQQATGIDQHAFEQISEAAGKRRVTRYGKMETEDHAQSRGLMDVCIIGLMRDALLRRSECRALVWSDLTIESDGSGRLLIRRSKTDQTGTGSIRYVSDGIVECLMALKTVTEKSSSDPMIGLSDSQINRRIASAAQHAGLEGRYSGHSPRIGMAIDLARDGVSMPALMEAGRWKSQQMPAHYVRAVEAGAGAVARWYNDEEEDGRQRH